LVLAPHRETWDMWDTCNNGRRSMGLISDFFGPPSHPDGTPRASARAFPKKQWTFCLASTVGLMAFA
jgi:hypothetical protein